MNDLTQRIKTYIKEGGVHCFCCGSTHVLYDDWQLEPEPVCRGLCCDCGTTWQEKHRVAEVTDLQVAA